MADETAASYDRVASTYAARYADELSGKPLDRALLDWFAGEVRGLGVSADVGCGPGQVARYLYEHGVEMAGVDLSPAMVAIAQGLTPNIPFTAGSILSLPADDRAWAGIVALYSIIHIPRADLPKAAAEFARVLQSGGVLLLSFHIGDETRHLTDWLGEPVSLDFHFFTFSDLMGPLEAAGFTVEAQLERQNYAEIEVETRRGYILARRNA